MSEHEETVGPRQSTHTTDDRTKRRNLITGIVLTLFFLTLITMAILGPNFFQRP